MKKLLPILLIFCGCYGDPISKTTTNNKNYSPELLFQIDSSGVYRFYDGGRYVYFVISKNTCQTMYDTQEGKVSVYHNVQTTTK